MWSEDRLVDKEYESLMRELMTFMMEDPHSIPCVLKAMFAARAIERICPDGRCGESEKRQRNKSEDA